MTNPGTETPDQARTRRRWITLAEAVAVAGVLIAALTLWLSWSDRREERAAAAAAQVARSRTAAVVTLRATRADGGRELTLADRTNPIDAIAVVFPSALGVPPQDGVPPTLRAAWLDDAAPLKGEAGRIPVLIAATYWQGETKRTDRAIYDLGWRRDGGLFGSTLKLESLILRERGGEPRRLDALWKPPSAG